GATGLPRTRGGEVVRSSAQTVGRREGAVMERRRVTSLQINWNARPTCLLSRASCEPLTSDPVTVSMPPDGEYDLVWEISAPRMTPRAGRYVLTAMNQAVSVREPSAP